MGHTGGSRKTTWRFMQILDLLGQRGQTKEELAKQLKCSQKTIQRDISYLQHTMHYRITCKRKKGESGLYVYAPDDAAPALPKPVAHGNEYDSLVLAMQMIEQDPNSPLKAGLQSFLESVGQDDKNRGLAMYLRFLRSILSFHVQLRQKVSALIMERVLTALFNKRTGRNFIQLRYNSVKDAREMRFVFEPVHLANLEGDWRLFGWRWDWEEPAGRKGARMDASGRWLRHTPRQTGWRQISVSRIVAAEPADDLLIERISNIRQTLQRPEFDPAGYFQNMLGTFVPNPGEQTEEVVVRFDKSVQFRVRERRWPEGSRMRRLKDGGVEVRLNIPSRDEFVGFILRWGPHAEVLSPPDVRALVRQAALDIAKKY